MLSPPGDVGMPAVRTVIDNDGISAAGRERIEEIQRARLLTAMVQVASENGVRNATIARIVARAGVSRRTFYEVFKDREECFLAALDEEIARTSQYVLEAYRPSGRWAERIRTALTTLLRFLDAEPATARILVIESLAAGPDALKHRQHVLTQIVAVIDQGRKETKAGSPIPGLTGLSLAAESIVGGALAVIHTHLTVSPGPNRPNMKGDRSMAVGDEALLGLVNPLMSMIVLPYLGPAASRRELKRPISKRCPAVEHVNGGDPLRELGMRVTYRTVRVLTAVAAKSGSSNREIGEAAGIADQGQISKLLARLERLGLTCNEGLAPGKGVPNAWALTPKGEDVARAMNIDGGRSVAPRGGSPR